MVSIPPYHTVVPGNLISNDSNINSTNIQTRYALENAIYASDEFKVSESINLWQVLGLLHLVYLGRVHFYTYNANGNTTDSAKYSSGQFVKTYINPEPRFQCQLIC